MTILNKKSSILVVTNLSDLVDIDHEVKLIKKASEMAKERELNILVLVIGSKVKEEYVREIKPYCDIIEIHNTDNLKFFNEEIYSAIVKEFINKNKPRFLLMNNDDFGKVITSRLAGYLDTSVITNCTNLEIDKSLNFFCEVSLGNNILGISNKAKEIQIATIDIKHTKIKRDLSDKEAKIVNSPEEKIESILNILSFSKKQSKESIDKAEILVVAGKGIRVKEDLELIRNFAKAIGGEIAYTRPLVQMGFGEHERQVGISGTTVAPKLIVTIGVSGAPQFTDAMIKSENIISINSDENAPIFKIAHCGLVGDLYEIVPSLLSRIK